MVSSEGQDRRVRAGRNQSLFRALNEKMLEMNEGLASVTETFVIACECADMGCIEMLDLRPDEYEATRADSRHFVVLPGHVYSDVERVVSEQNGFVVVEKFANGGEVADAMDPRSGDQEEFADHT
jgi:hypothetical protein